MSDFVSLPPSETSQPPSNLFRGGMMPVDPGRNVAALIVIDIRSLGLTAEQGQEIENEIREVIFDKLEKHPAADVADRSAIDLSGSVFGVAIE